jgi:hypothetical protein
MADGVQPGTPAPASTLLPAAELAVSLTLTSAPNGVRYASFGETTIADSELDRIVQAVPAAIAPALSARAFYFVPLAIPESGQPGSAHTVVSPIYTQDLADEAICHRNVQVPATASLPAHDAIFISAKLLRDQFALAFEFFINVGHIFSDTAGIPEEFSALAWKQALADVRGETSQDAFESRTQALGSQNSAGPARIDEKARTEFLEAAFADSVAIYLLSLAVDFDYAELREREYPLLAPNALADRLRLMARLFPPNTGYEFSIRYRRR